MSKKQLVFIHKFELIIRIRLPCGFLVLTSKTYFLRTCRGSSEEMNIWLPIFTSRRDGLDYPSENQPHIERQADLEKKRDLVENFMEDPFDTDEFSPGLEKLREVCGGGNSRSLRQVEDQNKEYAPVSTAWLDERSFEGGTMRSRPYRKPLAPNELYQELKKPVRCLFIDPLSMERKGLTSISY